jgi:hypothetical protein
MMQQQMPQQGTPQMMHQQPYAAPMQQQSPQPMAGQPIAGQQIHQSPSPQAQQPYGQQPQGYVQQQPQQFQQQGVQQPGMVYQQPQMAQAGSQPGFVHQNSNGMVTQQPQAGNQQTSQYQSAVPIATLGDAPAPIDCPSCHQRAMTSTTHVAGDCTHLWALGACFFTCFFCFVSHCHFPTWMTMSN